MVSRTTRDTMYGVVASETGSTKKTREEESTGNARGGEALMGAGGGEPGMEANIRCGFFFIPFLFIYSSWMLEMGN